MSPHGTKRTALASACTAKVDALVVVSLTVLVTAAPLLPPNGGIGVGIGTAALAVVAWCRRCRAAAPVSTWVRWGSCGREVRILCAVAVLSAASVLLSW
jgi:hypothetical protein